MLRAVSQRLYYTMRSLSDYTISPESLSKLKILGISEFFPIQADTYNHIIDGKDVVAQASTGSGKTIAFALPVIEQLQNNDLERLEKKGRGPRVLALAPTRELAKQTANVFTSLVSYGGLTVLPVYGGSPYHLQETVLMRGVDVVVGAPGRIKDLVERGSLDLGEVRHVVLDEVDRMLDMGFLPDVDDILKNIYTGRLAEGERPQTLLFSATMPPWIGKTSKRYLSKDNIEHIRLSEDELTPVNINHYCLMVPYHARPKVLNDLMTMYGQSAKNERCIIFCERKSEADQLATHPLMPRDCHVLHGDIPQTKRELVLRRFREGKYNTLITTDVAARGLDIPEVNLVIQCSPPKDTDFYIHRAGRTGRAGRNGRSICLYTRDEHSLIRKVEYDANIQFKPMKRPTLVDVVKANEITTISTLKAIPDDVIKVFNESAASIIEEMGAQNALAAALAHMSGRSNVEATTPPSVLSGRDGYTAMMFTFKVSYTPYKSFLYHVVNKKCGPHFQSAMSYVQFTKGKEAMVFDISNEALVEFEKAWEDDNRSLIHKLDTMPELEEESSQNKPGFQNKPGYQNKFGFQKSLGFRSTRSDRGSGFKSRGAPFNSRKRPYSGRDEDGSARRLRQREQNFDFEDTSF